MPNHRRLVPDVEGAHPLLDDSIRLRHPLVLAQALDERFDEEDFDRTARVGDVLKHVPAQGTVWQPKTPPPGPG